jgi:hypothetical protein
MIPDEPNEKVPLTSSGSDSIGATTLTGAAGTEWDELRRRCRSAESVLHSRLAAFSKTAAQLARLSQRQPPSATVTHAHSIQISSQKTAAQQSAFADSRAIVEQSAALEKEITQHIAAVRALCPARSLLPVSFLLWTYRPSVLS